MRIITYKTLLNGDKKPELVKENARNYSCDTNYLSHPGDIVRMINTMFNAHKLAEEYVWAVAFDNRNKPIGVFEVTHGTVNCSVVTPREVFTRLCLIGAVRFAVVHNHPSGEVEASEADRKFTTLLKSVGDIMNIKLIDSLIIGDGCYYSFMEHNEI